MRPAPTMYSISALRAVAAWHVVFHHFLQLIPGLKGGGYIEWYFSQRGNFGVDIFFVISGYIMVSTPSHATIRPVDFFLRRIFRIIPAYWAYTLLLAALSFSYPAVFHMAVPQVDHIAKSLFFIPHPNPNGLNLQYPLLTVGWTLYYEFIFYTLFLVTLIFSFAKRLPLLLLFLAILVFAYPWHWPGSIWFRDPLLLEFGMGAMVARLAPTDYLSIKRTVTRVAGVILISVSVLIILINYGTYWRIAASTLMVAGAIMVEPWLKSQLLLGHLGNISYSTYLSHGIVIMAIAPLLSLIPASIGSPVIFICGTLLIIFVSHISYYHLELPSISFGKAWHMRLSRPAQ